ncbi:MAG TPA: hypothetical protein VEU94_07125 [Terriglobales bacterium]|nr:hypothetical protein [Terriglobales bacterium]
MLSTPPPEMFDLKAHPDASILTAMDINKLSESERQFGIAPRRTKDVEYAEGVIVMEEGDKAIRLMAGDGMHWTFDANSPHVNEFQEGKSVFATGRAVGRIVGLKRQGDSVTAFLAPVQLTDEIKRGHFAMSQKIDVANMLTYAAPDFPQPPDELVGGTKTSSTYEDNDPQLDRAVVVSRFQNGRWVPTSVAQTYGDGRRVTYQRMGKKWSNGRVSLANVSPSRLADPLQRVRLSIPVPSSPALPAMPPLPVPGQISGGGASKNATVQLDGDDVRTKGVASNSGIGLQFYYHKNGVNIFSECLLRVINARVDFELNITDKGIEPAGVRVDGDLGIVMQAEAASEQNFANLHKTFYEPIDFSIPLGLNAAAGVPFSITFGSYLRLETGFSAKTSKLTAEGLYTFGGGVWAGMKNYQWSVSAVGHPHAEKDLGVTTTGVSVGINSLVVAASIRAMVGIGAFGFSTGVFVQVIFDGTILRGSDIASPIVGLPPCRQGTIQAFLYYGIGYSLPHVFVEIVNKLLALFTSYRLDEEGTIASSKAADLFHGRTEIPANCASSAKGGG